MDNKINKKKYDREYYLKIKRVKYYKNRYNIDINNINTIKIEIGPFTIIF